MTDEHPSPGEPVGHPPANEPAEHPAPDEPAEHPALDEPAEHPALDELSELDEQLLPPERAGEVRAHLLGCEDCRRQAESIATTRRRLAALPPVTMPTNVVARLDLALADAAAEQRPVAEPAEPGHAAEPLTEHVDTIVPNVTEFRRSRFTPGHPSAAALSVAAVVILAAIAVIIGVKHHSPSSSSGGTSAAESAPSSAIIAPPRTGGTVTATASGQTYTPTTLNTLVLSLVGSTTTSPSSAGAAGSAQTFSDTASPQAVAPVAGPRAATSLPDSLKKLYDSPKATLLCAAKVAAQADAVPVAVDFGYWTDTAEHTHKAPSLIIVFPGLSKTQLVVYVTGPTCDPNAPRTVHFVDAP